MQPSTCSNGETDRRRPDSRIGRWLLHGLIAGVGLCLIAIDPLGTAAGKTAGQQTPAETVNGSQDPKADTKANSKKKKKKKKERRYPLATLRQDFPEGLPIPLREKLSYEIRYSRFPIYATVGVVTFENLGPVPTPSPVPEVDPEVDAQAPLPTEPPIEAGSPTPPPRPLLEGLRADYTPRPEESLIHLRSTAASKGILLGILGIGVQDRFESLVNVRDFSARVHLTEVREGKRHRIQSAVFDPAEKIVRYEAHNLANPAEPVKTKILPREEGMHSLLSALYFVRLQRLREGQMLVFPVSDDEENYQFEVLVARNEKIKTDCGEVKAIRLEPKLFGPGKFFNRKGEMTMWVSRDRHQVPLRLVARTTSGTVSANLLHYRPNCQIQEPEEREKEMVEPDENR